MATVKQISPTVGVSGRYVVSQPFDTDILTTKTYTCVRVQTYSTATADLDNTLYETVYAPKGLSRDTMVAHTNSGVDLVTLQSDDGQSYYVPAFYITGIPNSNTKAYTGFMLTVDLGPLLTDEPIGELRVILVYAVNNKYGIVSQVSIVRYGASEQVEPIRHRSIEVIRNKRKFSLQNKTLQIADLSAKNVKLEKQIQDLSKYIVKNDLVPPTNVTVLTSNNVKLKKQVEDLTNYIISNGLTPPTTP